MNAATIITVGLTPVWDRTCYVDDIEWGDHTVIASETLAPAGKALNISKALAWLSVSSTAAGFWGESDYPEMTEAVAEYGQFIKPAFTVVKGKTRQNVTVVDTKQDREMHLRSRQTLITQESLKQLSHDLQKQLDPQAAVIFAGSVPEGDFQDECVRLVTNAGDQCADLIVDTSGSALSKIVNSGGVGAIKPNLEELAELLEMPVDNDVETVISAARQLCGQVKVIIVSLGAEGAVAVAKDQAIHCKTTQQNTVVHTVACGDYLLAGYVSVPSADISQKLAKGVKVATAKAWGWAGTKSWQDVQNDIEVEITEY